jgi:hypothetical protein
MMLIVDVTVGWWSGTWDRCRRLLGLVLAAMLIVAPAVASAATIDVPSLAQALQGAPAQVVGSPSLSLSRSDVRALRREIGKVDPGRIWIAVVRSMGEKATSRLADGLSGYLNESGGGTVVVVAGSSVWGSTSWEDGPAATARLAAAFKNPQTPLAVQLHQVVDSFASGDLAAGHPQLNASSATPTQTTKPSSPGPATAKPPSPGARSPNVAQPSRGGGTSPALIVGLVALALVLLAAMFVGGKQVRRGMSVSHRRREEQADVHEQAQADFIKLGEEIEALDIDSSMPNASAAGKDEYAKALDCYQEAERRLKQPDDQYQFERALDAIKQGRDHVHAAGQLLNPTDGQAAAAPAPGQAPRALPASGGSEPVATDQGRDFVDELAKLGALHDRGALTDPEFEEQKRKLLDR